MGNENFKVNNSQIIKSGQNETKQFDFIVVGQGLAGTLLTYCLREQEKKVLIIDKLSGNASRVAAGMFNPVTGRRLSLSWMATEFLEAANSIYTSLEKCLQSSFYYPKPIVRIFASGDDFKINRGKIINNEARQYVKHFLEDADMEGVKNPSFGICEITGGGYLDTNILLDSFRKLLKEESNLLEEDFEFSKLKFEENGISYGNISAEQIIFCEGFQAIYNPYFNWLPFNLAKGDVLTIFAPGLQQEFIINKGIYIVPVGGNFFRVGATYKWQTTDISPSEEAKAELETELRKIIKVPYEITEHKSGIRPTVKQRRPFLGFHPKYNRIAIFNGLGTRGVILAPFLAQHFANHILHQEPLFHEVDISNYDFENISVK